MGKLLTRLLRLACTTAADALVNQSAMSNVYVPQRPVMLASPRWEIADMLVSTLARTTAPNALVNYRILYVMQRLPVNSLLPQWIALMTCPVRLPSVLLARSTSSEYVTSVHETSKVPIAPMQCLAFVPCFVPSHFPLPAQGPNL